MDWAAHLSRILARIGEDVSYTPPAGGAATTVRGLFSRPYAALLGIESSNPTVGCMSADVPAIARGATFSIRGTAYRVIAKKDDVAAGVTVAELELI